MQKTEKKKTGLRIFLALVFLAAVVAAVFYARKQMETNRHKSAMSGIQSAAVTVGDVQHVVSADGNITDKDTEIIDVPSEVTVLKMTAHVGDQVKEGAPLADIHEYSAMQALSSCQKAEEDLDVKIHNAKDDVVSSIITAGDAKTGTLSKPVVVELGISDGDYAELLSGIGEGDSFYYYPHD